MCSGFVTRPHPGSRIKNKILEDTILGLFHHPVIFKNQNNWLINRTELSTMKISVSCSSNNKRYIYSHSTTQLRGTALEYFHCLHLYTSTPQQLRGKYSTSYSTTLSWQLKLLYRNTNGKLNEQTDLKEQRNFILFHFVYMWRTPTVFWGPDCPLRTACLFSSGKHFYLCFCVITFLILYILKFCLIFFSSKTM